MKNVNIAIVPNSYGESNLAKMMPKEKSKIKANTRPNPFHLAELINFCFSTKIYDYEPCLRN